MPRARVNRLPAPNRSPARPTPPHAPPPRAAPTGGRRAGARDAAARAVLMRCAAMVRQGGAAKALMNAREENGGQPKKLSKTSSFRGQSGPRGPCCP